jgi:hypothetical protein
MPEPQALRIAPAYRPTLVDPYREHLRRRRAEQPAVPVTHLLEEIRELGYTGSANLLVRYLNQGRAEGDRPVTTPRHASRLLLTDPENLRPKETTLLEKIAAACPEMTALADLVRGFATLLKPADGNDVKLTEWMTAARAIDLPHPAQLHQRSRNRPVRREGRPHLALPQRPHRRRQHPHQEDHEADARTRRIRPPPPPHPPALTATRRHH